VNEVLALVLILVLTGAGYAAGRLHAQLGYRMGYRFGYRQGYFDGDRSSWSRRRRELQAAVASVLSTPAESRAEVFAAPGPTGTTYTSDAGADAVDDPGRHGFADQDEDLVQVAQAAVEVRHPGVPSQPAADATLQPHEPRSDWALVDASRRNQPRHAQ
jgi:hypothetical protein